LRARGRQHKRAGSTPRRWYGRSGTVYEKEGIMMDRDSVRAVVRHTLAILARISRRTRTQADDLLSAMLQANEERVVDAVLRLLENPGETPTEAQIVEALKSVGIQV
jgi:hypothetical protein